MSEEQAVALDEVATETHDTVAAVEGRDVTEKPEGEAEKSEPKVAEGDDDDKPKSRHQRRKEQMDRLRAENAEIEAKLTEAQRKLASFEDAAKSLAVPKESDYSTYEEYQAALSAHHAMRMLDDRQRSELKRDADAHKAQMDRIAKERQQEVAQNWASQIAEAKTRYADFDQVVFTAPISDPVAQMVASMDAAADVAYHLGLHPEDARRISRLSPVEAAMELGRIEAKVSAPKPRIVTKAPDPASTVRGNATAGKRWQDMTPDEYNEWRSKGGVPTA